MKVLVVGSNGNLGCELVRAFGAASHAVDAFDRPELNAADRNAVRRTVLDAGYGAIVNAAAWNDVDGAEKAENWASVCSANILVPGNLAEAARDSGAAFIHYSTDYVFDGTKPEGYAEDDIPNPLSAYGKTKRAGEEAVLARGGRSFVVRTSKLFGPPGTSPASKPSFVSVMLRLAKEKPELSIVDEEVGCPTYTRDLAEATVRLLEGGYAPGVYHLVNDGPGVTWHGFAEEFFGLLGVTTPRKPAPATPRAAQRPKHAPLLNTKFPRLRPRPDALKAFFQEEGRL